jgi:hypothetical protein
MLGPPAHLAAGPSGAEKREVEPKLLGFEAMVNTACLHLLTLVGLELLEAEPPSTAARERAQ